MFFLPRLIVFTNPQKRRLLPYITQTILLLRFVFLSSAQCPTIIFQIHCFQRVPVCKNRDHNVPIFFGTIIVKRVNYYRHKQLSNSRYVSISHLFVGNYIFVSNLTSRDSFWTFSHCSRNILYLLLLSKRLISEL